MKKLVILLALLCTTATAQTYVPYNDIALGNANGIAVVLSNANVRVCSVPTSANPPCNTPLSNLRKLGTDGTCSTTSLSNPTNADNSGNYSFCAVPGQYVVETSKQRFGTIRVPILVTSVAGQGGMCPAGQVVTGINLDGTPVCAPESTASVTPHDLLGPMHLFTTAEAPPLQGDMIVGVSSGGSTTWTAVPKGNASFCWQMDPTGTFPLWAACPSAASTQAQPLTPPAPFAIPSGQAVAWSFPTICTPDSDQAGGGWYNGPATYQCGNASGVITRYSSAPLSPAHVYKLKYTGFQLPTLPSDAVIQNIYPVAISTRSAIPIYMGYDNVFCGVAPSPLTQVYQFTVPHQGYYSVNTSLGSTTGVVTGAECDLQSLDSLGPDTNSSGDQQVLQLVALAVYYTTATPLPNNTSSYFAIPYYGAINGISPAFVSVADGTPINYDAQGYFITNKYTTLNHLTATRAVNVANLTSGGSYILEFIQDATGGAAVTGGTGCTWIINNAATATIPVDTTANAITYMSFVYDGTNCLTSFPTVGGGGGGLADPGGNGIIKRTALNVTAPAAAGDVNTALGYTAANDANVIHTTGAEAAGGVKTFTNGIIIPGGGTADIGGLGFNGISTEFVETTGGTAPTVTSGCGTSPSIVGTDNAFTITGGTGTYSTCTVTFSRTWGHTPSCIANNQGSTSITLRATPTTTTVVIDASGSYAAGGKINALCF